MKGFEKLACHQIDLILALCLYLYLDYWLNLSILPLCFKSHGMNQTWPGFQISPCWHQKGSKTIMKCTVLYLTNSTSKGLQRLILHFKLNFEALNEVLNKFILCFIFLFILKLNETLVLLKLKNLIRRVLLRDIIFPRFYLYMILQMLKDKRFSKLHS